MKIHKSPHCSYRQISSNNTQMYGRSNRFLNIKTNFSNSLNLVGIKLLILELIIFSGLPAPFGISNNISPSFTSAGKVVSIKVTFILNFNIKDLFILDQERWLNIIGIKLSQFVYLILNVLRLNLLKLLNIIIFIDFFIVFSLFFI